ncbi:MAG: NUDIX hydrolase [Chitinophagaceae bacterium]|nr:NUDIX hydrolase [Chitinophagaceae bacterium]
MQAKTEIEELVSRYQLKYTAEMKELGPIIHFLQRTADGQLYDRSNFNGHITSSSFVLDEKRTSLLFIHHKKLNRWLQPGGHVDSSDENLLKAAIRETTEETGLSAESFEPVMLADTGAIFDIDSHFIPENPRKDEPSHTHHDCRFLFACNKPVSFNLNADEAIDVKWILLNELEHDAVFKNVAGKIMEVLNDNPTDTLADKLV